MNQRTRTADTGPHGPDNAQPRVFIASTAEDLGEFRAAARDAVLRAGCVPLMFEYWPGTAMPALAECLRRVDGAALLLVVVAHRYGWIPPEQPDGGVRSITWLECLHARGRDIEVIPFLVDEEADWEHKRRELYRLEKAAKDGAADIAQIAVEVTRNQQQLVAFKAWLDTIGVRATFATPDGLANAIGNALLEWHRAHGGPPPQAALAGYLEWLRRHCEAVELLGLDLKENNNVRLGQVYVPAVVLEGQILVPLLHRLGAGSLYVPGAPGAGKTTFCRWLALVLAHGSVPDHRALPAPEKYRETLPAPLHDLIPILCPLRELAGEAACLRGNGTWSRAQLEESLACWMEAKRWGGLDGAALRHLLGQGRCLLILDGVDELPLALADGSLPRRSLLAGLEQALPKWHKQGHRLLLTSRPYGLSAEERRRLDLPQAELAELPDTLQATFIRRWYAAADPPRAQEKAAGLLAHMRPLAYLTPLRANPMLLTALCVKYDEGQRLPQDLYELYDAVVTQVLYKRYANGRDLARRRLAAVALGMHQGVDRRRATPAAEARLGELEAHLGAYARSDRGTEPGEEDIAQRLDDLLSRSGLLLPRGEHSAGFYHLSFQEFLAATRLLKQQFDASTDLAALVAARAATPEWRNTLTFLFCGLDGQSPELAWRLFAPVLERLTTVREQPAPALLVAECLVVAHARGRPLAAELLEAFERACDVAMGGCEPAVRNALWTTRGRLGRDRRPGVGLRADGVPDIDWVEVPRGRFVYQEGVRRRLERFYIARYPVTHMQYQAFIDAGGYAEERWWRGWAHRFEEPEAARWPEPSRPRERVSWYEAVAFCRWLSARLNYAVHLPTEEQWEKAARGTVGRQYPWGTQYQEGYANIDETYRSAGHHYLSQTSVVGLYSAGSSAYGAMDMSGNVWEWCMNDYSKPNKVNEEENEARVLRGGSWDDDQYDACCSFRGGNAPRNRDDNVGFRVCCSFPVSHF